MKIFGRSLHFHRWCEVRNTFIHSYQVCSVCNMRRIERRVAPGMAHQPIDSHWLETGEWNKQGVINV